MLFLCRRPRPAVVETVSIRNLRDADCYKKHRDLVVLLYQFLIGTYQCLNGHGAVHQSDAGVGGVANALIQKCL